jgi:hypothetical protein
MVDQSGTSPEKSEDLGVPPSNRSGGLEKKTRSKKKTTRIIKKYCLFHLNLVVG